MRYSDACLAFMVTALVCAIVRWAHMCHPYNKEADYFYPARKQVTFFYSVALMQLPYYLSPADEGTWTYIRFYGIILYPMCFTTIFVRYFKWQQLKELKNLVFLCLPMLLLAIMMVATLLKHDTWFENQFYWMQHVVCIVSILLTVRLITITAWLKDSIDRYHKDNFATEADFPYDFAKKVIWAPLIWIAMSWAIYLTDSRDVKMAIDILQAVWMVAFLCTILHPQRMLRSKEVEQKIEEAEKAELLLAEQTVKQQQEPQPDTDIDPSTPQYSNEVKDMVLSIILHKFREPHLLKTEVLAEVTNGMTASASRFIASVGYYNLINMFRLRYAILYGEAHPQAKQLEVATAAGYLSDQALCRAKKNVKSIIPDYVKDVRLTDEDQPS